MNETKYIKEICLIKENVVKLSGSELREYKTKFYSNKLFSESQLDIFWELIWNDITCLEAFILLKNKKKIEFQENHCFNDSLF